ncbi:hypothetical protein ACFY2M_35090 [Streptomyces sp. NPDC001276]|uniref:hypothetical protein n=1 Tax=Streptomyces sp. NPDC001276 TaxID=3364555 RepID=UPI0036C27056
MDTDRWQGLTWDPLRNAVDVTIAHNEGLERHQLPVSWRLPEKVAPLMEKASPSPRARRPPDRVLTHSSTARCTTPQYAVLARAAESGWGLLELPARHTLDGDPEVAETLAATAARLLERGALANGEPLTESRIVIGAARTVQADAVRSRLAARDLTAITVDTANRLKATSSMSRPPGDRPVRAPLPPPFRVHRGGPRGHHRPVGPAPAEQPGVLDVLPMFPDEWPTHQVVMEHLGSGSHKVHF